MKLDEVNQINERLTAGKAALETQLLTAHAEHKGLQAKYHLAEAKLAQHGVSLPPSSGPEKDETALNQAREERSDMQYRYERVIAVAQEVCKKVV